MSIPYFLNNPIPNFVAFTAGFCYAVFFLARVAYRLYRWPLRTMPGPKLKTFLTGSSAKMSDMAPIETHEEWVRTYGPTFRYCSLLSTPMLFTADTTALRHILATSAVYRKSSFIRHHLGQLVGEGLLFVEGPKHKRQRRVMNPAFGPIQVRKFTEMFVSKSNEMRDIWMDLCSRATRQDGRVPIDAFAWLNKATLDIISLAGFNYETDALHAPGERPNMLNEAVRVMFSFELLNLVTLAQLIIPLLGKIPTERVRETAKAKKLITQIGMELIAEKRAAVAATSSSVSSNFVERKDIEGHDLLSLLIKSNMAADLPDDARLSDADILAQVPTFLVAGHETTSTAVAWTLFALSCDRGVQRKLREELRAMPTDTPSESELSSLTYLDHVVREVLRLHAPVYDSERVAVQDDIVPLRTPYTDTSGQIHYEIRVTKGDVINIPIQVLNRTVDLWGEDAREFRPDRWERLPETVKEIPNVFSNLLTFMAGSHACIGYRFSILEMKALTFAIIRHFEVELAVSPLEITRRTMIVGRPALATNINAGSQLPLLIRPVRSQV
ncbi:cytochrome P450 [Vararia minispora EC-137]|uniref:Cytochrome P450 n=1 Tax=Vararia minispora EC-137 TaxID=1314806 RepID=A0ACB8QZF6_9AGAM|nr:cytochrome P450 [Vararia minispora EC-137]